MCGIAGHVRFDDGPGNREVVARMCDRLVHRGPDHDGVHTEPAVALGERRLAIIDLRPEAAAPLCNEDGSIWVVFNGEIYNYQSLREELRARGHQFRTSTDTEVLVHLYEDYGADLVHRLRGMFAFAIWDRRGNQLFAARDRVGKKPLFYARDAHRFVFASELNALLADPRISREPDLAAIDAYLTHQYVPSPQCAFVGVRKLPAAHYLICTAGGDVRVERYWQPPAVAAPERSAVEWRSELLERLREAVRLRLVADVPVGAFLSGGIDSSLVVALMSEATGSRVRTFSIGSPRPEMDELPYARMVAERYDTDHHEMIVEPDSLDVIPTLVRHYGEPFADSSAVPTYHVSRLARQHVTVGLTGDGGDESFAGYDRYGTIDGWGVTDAVPAGVRRLFARGVETALASSGPAGMAARLRRGAVMLAGSVPVRYGLHLAIFKPREKQALYTPSFVQQLAPARPEDGDGSEYNGDAVRWMMRHDLQHYLPDCLMVKSDIASMANSLEIRSPLLDHEIIEFASTLPRSMLRDGRTGKLVLRDVARPFLPQPLFDRPKTGFGIPVADWFRGSLSGMMRSVLLSDAAAGRGLFDRSALALMIGQHEQGQRDWSNRLWALLMLELWFREFID